MRWALAGLLAAGGLITAFCLGWIGLPPVPGTAVREDAWQVRELIFLKAAYDRMQQDAVRQTDASASLHAERERIVRQMADTAKLLPAEAVPAELRALLGDAAPGDGGLGDAGLGNAGAVPASLSQLIETIEAEERLPGPAEGRPPDLRVGLRVVSGGGPRPLARAAGIAIDAELREPIGDEPASTRAPRRKPRDDAGRDQQGQDQQGRDQ